MLVANQPKMELGQLKFGIPHNFNYVITNSSNTSIKINKIILGCGSCTKAVMGKNVLNPGDVTDLNVTFTPGSTGIQLKSINVLYNDKEHLYLKFTAKVDG